MKKVLLATSALVMTTGFAAAEITISGDARMGLHNGFVLGTGDDETGFTSRARVKFTLSGETDSGLAFGGSFRADNAGNAASGHAGSVYISGAFGKLSMGDVDGAATAAVGHIDGVGLTGLDDLNESTYFANGGLGDVTDLESLGEAASVTDDPTALYEYTTGGFGLYISATQPRYAFDSDGAGDMWEGDAYALGANYTVDAYKFSIGYESLDLNDLDSTDSVGVDQWVLGADATFGSFTVKARYGQGDVESGGVAAADFEQLGLSGTYSVDALSVTAYVQNKQYSFPTGANIEEIQAIGIGASYDLGGGASVVGGIAQLESQSFAAPSEDDTAFDLGLSFSF